MQMAEVPWRLNVKFAATSIAADRPRRSLMELSVYVTGLESGAGKTFQYDIVLVL
jgi:hypothetical protein